MHMGWKIISENLRSYVGFVVVLLKDVRIIVMCYSNMGYIVCIKRYCSKYLQILLATVATTVKTMLDKSYKTKMFLSNLHMLNVPDITDNLLMKQC